MDPSDAQLAHLKKLKSTSRPLAVRVAWFFFYPCFVYAAAYFLLTMPQVLTFNTHYFGDEHDGLMNAWNLWWFREAVLHGSGNPFFTDHLHFPRGVWLFGHTFQPLHGAVGLVLSAVLTPVQVYNTIITLTFVLTGLTTFWLCLRLTGGAYWPSIAGGYLFTFSSYHWGHAQGHMNLISLQFIPLFVLCWMDFLSRPTWWRGVLAGLVLGLNIWIDYYHCLYSVMIGGMMFLWLALHRTRPGEGEGGAVRRRGLALGAFVLAALITCLPQVLALQWLDSVDPLHAGHFPWTYSADLSAIFIPGKIWFFNELTRWSWGDLIGNDTENSIYLGLAGLVAAAVGVVKYRGANPSNPLEKSSLWVLMGFIFMILSFGPALRFRTEPIVGANMPYGLLEQVFPMLKISGMPVRMMVMTMLCVSILAARGLAWGRGPRTPRRVLAYVAFVLVMVLESLPRLLPTTPATPPNWVLELSRLPEAGGVLDLKTQLPNRMAWHASIHGHPIALGDVSRWPASAESQKLWFRGLVRQGRWDELRDRYGFSYVVTGHPIDHPRLKPVYQEDRVVYLYRFVDPKN